MIRRKYYLSAAFAGLLAISASVADAADKVKIGVLVPLSRRRRRSSASTPQRHRAGAGRHQGRPAASSRSAANVNLISADVPAPNAAASAAQRLITQNGVVGILGSFVSSITLAIVGGRPSAPAFRCSPMSFADQITGRGFKIHLPGRRQGSAIRRDAVRLLVAIAKKAGEPVTKVAILYEDTAYGTAQAKGLRDAANERASRSCIDEGYPLGITDATPLINKLRASGAELVFPVSYFNDSLLIIRTMTQQQARPADRRRRGRLRHSGLREGARRVLRRRAARSPRPITIRPRDQRSFQKKYGTSWSHEALSTAVCLEALVQAIDVAKSNDPDMMPRCRLPQLQEVRLASPRGLPGGCTAFDDNGLNTVVSPLYGAVAQQDSSPSGRPRRSQGAGASGRARSQVLDHRRPGARWTPLFKLFVDGVLIGGVYGVIAIGLSLVFGVIGIVNFAQAEFLMIGMYVAWFAWRYLGLDPLLGAGLSFVVVFVIGALVQRFLIERVLKAPNVAQIFLTVGLLIVLENSALLLFGSDVRSVKTVYQTEALRSASCSSACPTWRPSLPP